MTHKERIELIEHKSKLLYPTGSESNDDWPEGYSRNEVASLKQSAFIAGANFALEMERWVKVGEQTPKDYERVLASNGIYQVVCEYKHGCFWDELEQIRGIVIWQPLPKLPK